MAQRPCPNCGTIVAGNQRFCSNCGTAMDTAVPPSDQYPQQQQQQYYPSYPQGNQQVPPYAQSPQSNQQVPPYAQTPQQQSQSPIGEAAGAVGLLYLLRRGRRGTGRRRQRSGCCSCLVVLLILAIIAIPILYVFRTTAFTYINKNLNLGNYRNNSITSQPPITTTQINESVPYAGVNLTVVNAQQSSAFIDDTNSATNGMIRLNLHEQGSSSNGNYVYSEIARLILPGGNSVAPVNAQQALGPNAGVSRTNWLDFPVPTSVKTNQLTLRLGSESEAQMDMPLTGDANLKQYQTKTVQPNVKTNYAGLVWTITSATSAWSNNGQQATKGNLFVTLTLSVDNLSQTDFNAYWGDYVRLKSGATTSSPSTDSTLPLNFPVGSSGTKGTVIFTMPQGSTSYTLILLNTPSTNFDQATADFQLA